MFYETLLLLLQTLSTFNLSNRADFDQLINE